MLNWQTILSGGSSVVSGLAVVYFSVVLIPPDAIDSSIRSTLALVGVGMITAGAGLMAARANATSVAAHQESLDKIQEGQSQHLDNQAKIASLAVAVDKVPEVVAKVVAEEAPARLSTTTRQEIP